VEYINFETFNEYSSSARYPYVSMLMTEQIIASAAKPFTN